MKCDPRSGQCPHLTMTQISLGRLPLLQPLVLVARRPALSGKPKRYKAGRRRVDRHTNRPMGHLRHSTRGAEAAGRGGALCKASRGTSDAGLSQAQLLQNFDIGAGANDCQLMAISRWHFCQAPQSLQHHIGVHSWLPEHARPAQHALQIVQDQHTGLGQPRFREDLAQMRCLLGHDASTVAVCSVRGRNHVDRRT